MRPSIRYTPSAGAIAIASIAILVAALALLGGLSYQSLGAIQFASDARSRADFAMSSLNAVLSDLLDAETGQRGYLLSGDTVYLDPYQKGLRRLDGDTASLARMAEEDAAIATAWKNLGPLIPGRLAHLDSTLSLRRTGGADAARTAVMSGQGKRQMDEIRSSIARSQTILATARDARAAQAAAFTRVARARAIIGAIVLLLVTIAGASAWFALASRLSAARALEVSERRLFDILEQMPVGVFVVDAQGRSYFANRASTQLLGRGLVPNATISEIREIYQVYESGTKTPYSADRLPISRALRGEHVHATDIDIHAPGRVTPLEVWAAPVYDAAGRVTLAVATFDDITERLRSQREIDALTGRLQHQVAELEMVNQELETFSYSVSHDLRAPLRAINGFARIIQEDHGPGLNSDTERLLGVIQHNAARMGELIDDLLDFSRFSRTNLSVANIDMTALARSVVTDLQQGLTPSGADVVVASMPQARADQTLVRQVWTNLIGNALKYSRMQPMPHVEIGSLDTDAGALDQTFFVRDNGVGFDMQYANKLFGVFQRLHSRDEFEGTGVGLAIVQRIVRRHGGKVWAHSELDRGATFYFSLPAQGSQ